MGKSSDNQEQYLIFYILAFILGLYFMWYISPEAFLKAAMEVLGYVVVFITVAFLLWITNPILCFLLGTLSKDIREGMKDKKDEN